MCAWKNPSGKRLAPGTAPSQAPPIVPPQGPPPKKVAAAMMSRKSADPATPKQERGRKSISVISPAVVKVSRFSYHFSLLHGISFIPPNFLLKKTPSLLSFLFCLDAGKARLFCLLLLSCSSQCFTNVGTGETDCKFGVKV